MPQQILMVAAMLAQCCVLFVVLLPSIRRATYVVVHVLVGTFLLRRNSYMYVVHVCNVGLARHSVIVVRPFCLSSFSFPFPLYIIRFNQIVAFTFLDLSM